MKKNIKDKLFVLPIVLIIAIVPLIVRYKRIELGEVVASYWIGDYNIDFFSYYKMIFLLGFTFLALISFYIYSKKEPQAIRANNSIKKLYYYPIAVYIVMVIISTIFSEAQLTSLTGFPDRYEGMPVLLSYMLIVIITINLFRTKEQFKFIINALLTSAFVIAIIGLSQFFEADLMQTSFGKWLMLPHSGFTEISQNLDSRFDGNNILFATLYNPNYAGSYFSMLFILSSVLYFFEEKIKRKVILGGVTVLMFAAWLGSLSRAGILGSLFALVILSVILRKEIIKRWKSIFIITLVFLLVFSFMDFYTEGSLRREFLSLGEETQLALSGETAEIEEVKNEDGFLIFNTAEEKLKFKFDGNGKLYIADKNNNSLDYILDNNNYKFTKPKLDNYSFNIYDNILKLNYGNKTISFIYSSLFNQFLVIGIKNNHYFLKEVKSWGFEGKEMLASKRGYIWSRTTPLLGNTLFTGYGPDTFALFFPQHDVIGKIKYFNSPAILVDKAHNFYLQIWTNTGFISLLALIILFLIYLSRNIFYFFNINFSNFYSQIGIAFLGATLAYFTAALFNDSVISVAPVFWTILGLGVAIELKRY